MFGSNYNQKKKFEPQLLLHVDDTDIHYYTFLWFQPGVKDTVVVTEKMEDFWKQHNEKYAKYVLWR